VLTAIVVIIFIALVFDFINGFHDAANSIATVVSTRVLTPLQAVVWAAFFNFVAAFGFGVSVARTVGKGVVDTAVVDQWVIVAGLIGAIVWDLITWAWGLPTSSSHALIGGFAGAAVVKAGFGSLIASGLVKIGLFMILAPLIGLLVGFVMMVLVINVFKAWGTAPTTPRRRWGSSRYSCSRPATSVPSSTCRSGSCWQRTRRSVSAPWRAAGAS
jgi:PiT family inorganic phosphate transporter